MLQFARTPRAQLPFPDFLADLICLRRLTRLHVTRQSTPASFIVIIQMR
jgi:hypothetical protein